MGKVTLFLCMISPDKEKVKERKTRSLRSNSNLAGAELRGSTKVEATNGMSPINSRVGSEGSTNIRGEVYSRDFNFR